MSVVGVWGSCDTQFIWPSAGDKMPVQRIRTISLDFSKLSRNGDLQKGEPGMGKSDPRWFHFKMGVNVGIYDAVVVVHIVLQSVPLICVNHAPFCTYLQNHLGSSFVSNYLSPQDMACPRLTWNSCRSSATRGPPASSSGSSPRRMPRWVTKT